MSIWHYQLFTFNHESALDTTWSPLSHLYSQTLTASNLLHSLYYLAPSDCLGRSPAEVTALLLTVHHCMGSPEQDFTRRRQSVIGSSVWMALSHSISRQDALRWGHMACLTGKERVWMAQNDKMLFFLPLAMSCFQGREACRGADRYSARRKTVSSPRLTSPSESWGFFSLSYSLTLSLLLEDLDDKHHFKISTTLSLLIVL